MRKIVIALSIAFLPSLAAAQVQNCSDCVLGLWDDLALTSNRGTIVPNEPKDIYLGIKLGDPNAQTSGVEFSITGLRGGDLVLLGAVPLGPRALVWGTIPAPSDTSALSEGDGGSTVAWSQCLTGSVALMRLTLFTTKSLTDQVLLVKRSYPTTSPEYHTPVLMQCNRPYYTTERVSGGCFVLNWTGAVELPCADVYAAPVTQISWSGVRALYR